MTEPRILTPPDLGRLDIYAQADMEDQATRDNVRDFAVEYLPHLLATVRYWQDACDELIVAACEDRQEAAEATRRAEAAEERCEALREALRVLAGHEQHDPHAHRVPGRWDKDGSPCVRCADFEQARVLLEES